MAISCIIGDPPIDSFRLRIGGGTSTSKLIDGTYQSCALYETSDTVRLEIPQSTDQQKTESFTDGLTLGWGVASVIVTVYVIRRIYR